MAFERKHSLTEKTLSENNIPNDLESVSSRRWRRPSLAAYPWMNKIKPFIYGAKNDDAPDGYNRVRYIRDSCKVFSDLWKTDKDFLNKSIDSDVSKAFKEFRLTDVARDYRSPYGTNGAPSILNETIDDLVQIHDYIDSKRKELCDQIKKVIEQARDKQSNIRQTITEVRDNFEKAQRKLETADTNLKKFQTRSDRLTLTNFDERCREFEDIRCECEQNRTLTRDIYATEICRISGEEHNITQNIFTQYLFVQNKFYNDISKYFSSRIPEINKRLDENELKPSFGCDLNKHCSTRIDTNLAYPIETCIRLLKTSIREEGLFRIAPSHVKQKKLVAELDLQLIDKSLTLNDLYYDPHVPASTLKQYLRELPDCLLTNTLAPQWNQAATLNEQSRLQKISQLINQLPKVNYENLCYLVRFLARVASNSSENKMSASNLGICIGCSILYTKEQTSLSNSFTNGSTILEIMINNYKQLFPNDDQSFKSQPDLIPTEFHPKSRSVSNENILEAQNLPGFPQPSPGTRRKNKAPLPPPPSSASHQTQNEHFFNQQIPSEQTSNQNLTGKRSIHEKEKEFMTIQSTSVEETSTQSNQFKNLYRRFTKVTTSSSFTPSDLKHRRTASGGAQLDRPGAPPPLPPPVIVVATSTVQYRDSSNAEEETFLSTEDKLNENLTPTTNDGVNVGKLISELNNRMAAVKGNNTQTPNNIRASHIRNSTITSPGETTDF